MKLIKDAYLARIIPVLFVFVSTLGFSQVHEYVYRNTSDSTFNCYLKVLPGTKKIKGLVVRDYSALPDMSTPSPFKFSEYCTDNGLMVLYTVSSNFFPELFYSDSSIYLLDEMISEVIEEYKISPENIFIGGISASGTRALRYAQFCEQGKSKSRIHINGVFAVDSPLDLSRFYYSVMQHKINFKEGMLWEAELMERVFPEKMGGSPQQFPERYLDHSVFSHGDSSGGNAKLLKDVNLVLFHEPDIDWWMNERGASYYDINSYDISAFVVTLRTLGSTRVELITTTGKGFDRQGNRNCHSWTIVDELYLVNWILDRLK